MTSIVAAALAACAAGLGVLLWRERRCGRRASARAAENARDRDDARARAGRAETEAARVSVAIRALSGKLAVATELAEESARRSLEADGHRADSARRLLVAMQEISAMTADAAALSEAAFAVHERGSEAVARMSDAARDVSRSLRRVSEISERIATGAAECRQAMERARQSATRLGDRNRDHARRARELPAVAERLISSGEAVRFAVTDFEKENSAVMGVVLQAGHEVEDLGKRVEEIGSILDFLSSVAEETNLLALNAAIIAAEAGAEGRGFAVVAEEIRELSERMASSTREIAALIDAVKSGVRDAADIMRKGGDRSSGARKIAQQASHSLDGLLREADLAARLVRTTPAERADDAEADATAPLDALAAHLSQTELLREELRGERHRIDPVIASIQAGVESVESVVAESARGHADIAARLTRMKDVTLPIARIGEEYAACEESCRQSGDRLQVTMADVRQRVKEVEAVLGRAEPAEAMRPRVTPRPAEDDPAAAATGTRTPEEQSLVTSV